ncbi:unnamed protein product [Pedinophyceae sp. YPF-701]|nr:unnamed protein product [Pedinophyceae sp. YPF-701]
MAGKAAQKKVAQKAAEAAEAVEAAASPDLKRLEFVDKAAKALYENTSAAYANAKGKLPQVVMGTVIEPIEGLVGKTMSTSYATQAQEAAPKIMATADQKIDMYITRAFDAYETQKAFVTAKVAPYSDQALAQLQTAREAYLTNVELALGRVRAAFPADVGASATAAADRVHAAIADARGRITDFNVVGKVHESWTTFLRIPVVHAVAMQAEPHVVRARGMYSVAHDAVVSNAYYAQAHTAACALAGWIAGSWPAQQASRVVTPAYNRYMPTTARTYVEGFAGGVASQLRPLVPGA